VTQPLDGFPLLSELTADERRALEGYLEPRELDGGSTLYRAGEEADALYFVLEGAITVRDGGQSLAELVPGEVLGALSIVSVGKRECQVVGATSTRLLSLSREGYLRLRDELPALALRLQETILRSFSTLVRGVLEDSRAS
jgi:CRP-like cAMP-binding protein